MNSTRDDLDRAFTATAMVRKLSNPGVESDLIGVCIAGAGAYRKTIGRVQAQDFYVPCHAWLWQEISRRYDKGEVINAGTLREFADRLDKMFPDFTQADSMADFATDAPRDMRAYISRIVANAPGPGIAATHADQIHELAQRRRLVDASLQTMAEALDTEDATRLVGDALGRFETLMPTGGGKSRHDVIAALIHRAANPLPIYPTGYARLDEAMGGGMEAGRVYGFAALGKVGKSLFAGGVSQNFERDGVPHTYIALEMGSLEIEQRAIAAALGLNSLHLRGQVHPSTQMRLVEYQHSIGGAVRYVDMPGGDMVRLRSEVMAARYRHGSAGVIIDYWQLIGGRDRGVSEEEHLRRVAEWLAAAAKRLQIWILVMAQLADDGEATAISRTGLVRNVDQLFFIRGAPDTPDRWMEMRASRYTPSANIGSEFDPAFKIGGAGPQFLEA